MTTKTGFARSVRRLLALLGTSGVAALAGAGESQAQMSVSPIILEIATESAPVSRTISVSNGGDKALHVRFYPGDFEQTETGENQFADLGTFARSCRERIRVYPDQASVLPGETQDVRVDMEPGAEGCWSAVFFETASVARDGSLVRQRIAAKVYGTLPGARAEGEITQLDIREEKGTKEVALTFRNVGEAPLRPQGTLEIRNFEGEVVAKTEIDAFSALPGRDRTVRVPLGLIGNPGEYLAVPILDFGGAYLAGGQLAFEVKLSDIKLAAEPKRDGQQ